MNRLPHDPKPDPRSDGPHSAGGGALQDSDEALVGRALAELAAEREALAAPSTATTPEEEAFVQRAKRTIADAEHRAAAHGSGLRALEQGEPRALKQGAPRALEQGAPGRDGAAHSGAGERPRQALLSAASQARTTEAGPDRGLFVRWAAAALLLICAGTALALMRDKERPRANDVYLGAPGSAADGDDDPEFTVSPFTGTVDWADAHEREFASGAVEYTLEVRTVEDGVERQLWESPVLLEPEWICTSDLRKQLPATFIVEVVGRSLLADEERTVLRKRYMLH